MIPEKSATAQKKLPIKAILAIAGLLIVVLVIFAVSRRPAAVTGPPVDATKKDDRSDSDLRLALDGLDKLAESAEAQPAQRALFYLNQWISSYQPANVVWEEDELVKGLHRSVRIAPGLESLAAVQFTPGDLPYFQQSLWLHSIATRIGRESPPAELIPWLKRIEKEVGLPESEQLAKAERLFDWTICNLQLDALPPQPKMQAAVAGARTDEPIDPALHGEVGPGYANPPLQILLYGHGDAHERARIFILLCRQAGIDAVMLGLKEGDSPEPRGWLPAVLVSGQLYLFEPALGLPVSGPGGQGIATLDQVVADPKLIRQFDIAGQPPYIVSEKDLATGNDGSIYALIDAEPAALSRRMQLLQSALPSTKRLALAPPVKSLKRKLEQCKSIRNKDGVDLWRAPLRALLYQYGHQQVVGRDQEAARKFSILAALFAPERPLVKARNFHLQGIFENVDDKKGARALYMECRPPDREIDALESSEYFRTQVGLNQALPQDPAQRKAYLDHFITIARAGKFNATYWLGLTYYESGKYSTATEWLGQRTVEAVPPSPWTAGARYNLARCYEKLGNPELARQWLESDQDSPQRPGNLLRAQRLKSGHAN